MSQQQNHLAAALDAEAWWRTVKDAAAAQYAAARADAQRLLEEQHPRQRTVTDQLAMDGLGHVGKVTLPKTPEAVAVVTDPVAFRAWVRANADHQLTAEWVVAVRPAYERAVLKEMTDTGAPEIQLTDEQGTTTAHVVPGVEMLTPPRSHHRITLDGGAQERILAAWRSGQRTPAPAPEKTADTTA